MVPPLRAKCACGKRLLTRIKVRVYVTKLGFVHLRVCWYGLMVRANVGHIKIWSFLKTHDYTILILIAMKRRLRANDTCIRRKILQRRFLRNLWTCKHVLGHVTKPSIYELRMFWFIYYVFRQDVSLDMYCFNGVAQIYVLLISTYYALCEI